MFSIFLVFFWNFLVWVEYERNSGVKFFFLFLGLSHPVLAKNTVGKKFFNFLKFFAIFLGILLHESSMNGIRKSNFFLSFSAYLIRFWQKIISERGFLIFWIFFLFFSEFSCRVEYARNLGLKFFFSLSRSISSSFG